MTISSGGTIAQSRLTYQHMIGAGLAMGIIGDDSVVAVHCEDLDDLLLELADGSLICVQVTAKETGKPPLKARDPKVVDTFKTFCILEKAHASQIERFTFIASCGFFNARRDGQNLQAVLDQAKGLELEDAAADPLVKQFFRAVSASAGPEHIASFPMVAEKTTLISQPAYEGAYDYLFRSIAVSLQDRGLTPECIDRILTALVHRVEQAASRRLELANQTFLAAVKGRDALLAEQLALKRIDASVLNEIFRKEIALVQLPHPKSPILANEAFPSLRRKLSDNGGTEASIMSLQMDAYHALTERRARQVSQGSLAASRYNDKLRAFSLRLYERVHSDLEFRGMLNATELYRNITDAVASELRDRHADFPDTSQEEVLGTLAVLTDECFASWGPNASPRGAA